MDRLIATLFLILAAVSITEAAECHGKVSVPPLEVWTTWHYTLPQIDSAKSQEPSSPAVKYLGISSFVAGKACNFSDAKL